MPDPVPDETVEAEVIELAARYLVGPANPPLGDQELSWEDVGPAERDRLRRAAKGLLEAVLPALRATEKPGLTEEVEVASVMLAKAGGKPKPGDWERGAAVAVVAALRTLAQEPDRG